LWCFVVCAAMTDVAVGDAVDVLSVMSWMCAGLVAACVGAFGVFSVEESDIVVMSLTSEKFVLDGLVSVERSRGVSRSSVVVEVASCCAAVGVSSVSCRGGGVATF
jgi:hypothetical protein